MSINSLFNTLQRIIDTPEASTTPEKLTIEAYVTDAVA